MTFWICYGFLCLAVLSAPIIAVEWADMEDEEAARRKILTDYCERGEHMWPCEHAPGGAGACKDSDCPAYKNPSRSTFTETPAVSFKEDGE